MNVVFLALALAVGFAAAGAAPWVCSQLVRNLVKHWREAPTSVAYNPLLEMVRPQARHVVEVHEQAPNHDKDGSPLDPAAD